MDQGQSNLERMRALVTELDDRLTREIYPRLRELAELAVKSDSGGSSEPGARIARLHVRLLNDCGDVFGRVSQIGRP